MAEYLSAAVKEIYQNESWQKRWVNRQSDLLKNNESRKVLEELSKHDPKIDDNPITQCYRYINNRLDQLDYKNSIEQELPQLALAELKVDIGMSFRHD